MGFYKNKLQINSYRNIFFKLINDYTILSILKSICIIIKYNLSDSLNNFIGIADAPVYSRYYTAREKYENFYHLNIQI